MATHPAFTPSEDQDKAVTPKIKKVEFDGSYSQRVGIGLPNHPEKWRVVFPAQTATNAETLLTFYAARNGTEPFDFEALDNDATAKYVASDWNKTPRKKSVNRWDVAVTMERVFDL